MRSGIFEPWPGTWFFLDPVMALAAAAFFGEIAPADRPLSRNLWIMSKQPASTAPRQIVWPTVITVISAAILIGAEVFGAAFAGGWALAVLFGLNDTAAHIVQIVLFVLGVLVMIAFIRAAQRVEPFTRRA
jgi:nitric oxide reductase large subunit